MTTSQPAGFRLSVLVPVYNEEATVSEVIDRIAAVPLDGVVKEIIVVDDGSTDSTRQALERVQRDHPGLVRVLFSRANSGKGAAIRAAIAAATGDVLLIQDADLELDPEEYPALLAPILRGGASVVYGSRFLDGRNRNIKRRTRWANRALTLLTNVLFGCRLTDMATAYKVFRREALRGIRLTAARFELEPEITARFCQRGLRIVEVPVSYHPRTEDEGKKIRWRDGLQYVATLVRCRLSPPG